MNPIKPHPLIRHRRRLIKRHIERIPAWDDAVERRSAGDVCWVPPDTRGGALDDLVVWVEVVEELGLDALCGVETGRVGGVDDGGDAACAAGTEGLAVAHLL